MPYRRYTVEQRQAYVDAYKASGKTQRQFCEDAGLNAHTLTHWLNRGITTKPSGQLRARFVELEATPAAPQRAPVRVAVHVGGLRLAFEQLPPASYLAELARELG